MTDRFDTSILRQKSERRTVFASLCIETMRGWCISIKHFCWKKKKKCRFAFSPSIFSLFSFVEKKTHFDIQYIVWEKWSCSYTIFFFTFLTSLITSFQQYTYCNYNTSLNICFNKQSPTWTASVKAACCGGWDIPCPCAVMNSETRIMLINHGQEISMASSWDAIINWWDESDFSSKVFFIDSIVVWEFHKLGEIFFWCWSSQLTELLQLFVNLAN